MEFEFYDPIFLSMNRLIEPPRREFGRAPDCFPKAFLHLSMAQNQMKKQIDFYKRIATK